MISKLKRSIICLSLASIFFCTSIFGFIEDKKVYADAFALSAITNGLFFSEGVGALTSTLTVAAPYAAAVVAAGLAAGVVYKHRDSISAFAQGAFSYIQSVGIKVGESIKIGADNVAYLSSQAKTAILDYITLKKGNRYQELSTVVKNLSIPAGETVWTNFSIPFTKNLNLGFMSEVNYYNVRMVLKSSDGTIFKPLTAFTSGTLLKMYFDANRNLFVLPSSLLINNTYIGDTFTLGFENSGTFDVNADIYQSLDFDFPSHTIPNNPTYNDNVFSNPYPTKVGVIDKTATWDTFIDKVYTDVMDKVLSSTETTTDEMDSITDKVEPPDIDLDLPDSVKLDFSPLYINLQEVFPFSIPFDLVNMVKGFASTSEVPNFKVEFPENSFVGGGSFEIDFKKFEKVAFILKYFILITFCVNLIKKTRELVGGD